MFCGQAFEMLKLQSPSVREEEMAELWKNQLL